MEFYSSIVLYFYSHRVLQFYSPTRAWGSEFARTRRHGNRFRFRFVRACKRADGRAGDQRIDVRSDFREKSDPSLHLPFSFFGPGGLPASLNYMDFHAFEVHVGARGEIWVILSDLQIRSSEFLRLSESSN